MTTIDSGSFSLEERLRILGRDATTFAEIEAILPEQDEPYPISRPMARFLARLVIQLERRAILEFGAGRSSLVMATALQLNGGGRLTSVEHQPKYARGCWDRVEQLPMVDARLVVANLRLSVSRHGCMHGYPGATPDLRKRAPYDLVLIDAPPEFYGRDAPMYQVYPLLAPNSVIVLDDAARMDERTALRRWLDTFPGLRLAFADLAVERGMAVMVHDGNKRRRLAPRAIAGTFRDRVRHYREQGRL